MQQGVALSLPMTGNLNEATARLLAVLHQATTIGRPIVAAPVPLKELGATIIDRLRRAAAPRGGRVDDQTRDQRSAAARVDALISALTLIPS